jgi:hypothetical protein
MTMSPYSGVDGAIRHSPRGSRWNEAETQLQPYGYLLTTSRSPTIRFGTIDALGM